MSLYAFLKELSRYLWKRGALCPCKRQIPTVAHYFSKFYVKDVFNCKIFLIRICVRIKPFQKCSHTKKPYKTLYFFLILVWFGFCFVYMLFVLLGFYFFYIAYFYFKLEQKFLLNVSISLIYHYEFFRRFSLCYFNFFYFPFASLKKPWNF